MGRVPLSSFFPQILINFSYFPSNFTYFLPLFGPPDGLTCPLGKALATTLAVLFVRPIIVHLTEVDYIRDWFPWNYLKLDKSAELLEIMTSQIMIILDMIDTPVWYCLYESSHVTLREFPTLRVDSSTGVIPTWKGEYAMSIYSQDSGISKRILLEYTATTTSFNFTSTNNNNNNNNWIYLVHFPLDQSTVAYYYYYQSGNRHNHCASPKDDLQPAKRTPYPHFDCNISHNRQVPDMLWSTKQIEIKYLAQGHKHAGRSRAQTHNIDGLVIMSPALFR